VEKLQNVFVGSAPDGAAIYKNAGIYQNMGERPPRRNVERKLRQKIYKEWLKVGNVVF
jgi:hypothetical protein